MSMNSAQLQDMSELRSRVEWLDEERRKYLRRLAEIEQQLNGHERKSGERDQRLQDLEQELAAAKAQIARIPQVDTMLQQFKDEMVQLIEQYDGRRVAAQDESERRRRIEQEVTAREIAEIRKELPAIARLQNNMEQRTAEENRLAHLIGIMQNKLTTLDSRLEDQAREIAYTAESEKQNNRLINEQVASIHEINRRWEPINSRIDSVAASTTRTEANISGIVENQETLRKTIENWSEQVQLGEYQRNQRLQDWKQVLEEQQNIIEQFQREWIRYSELFNEAKMALQTVSEWQKHIENQQREMGELARVEANRMRARWEEFQLEAEKRWKNVAIDTEQRWSAANRGSKAISERIVELEGLLTQLQQDRELMWRVQSAQTDALKMLPRIWQEEVEKAISQNPNRRRQPTLVPTPDEFE